MSEEEALQWVREQDDEHVDADELDKAFIALYGRSPSADENAWSMVRTALEKAVAEASCFPPGVNPTAS